MHPREQEFASHRSILFPQPSQELNVRFRRRCWLSRHQRDTRFLPGFSDRSDGQRAEVSGRLGIVFQRKRLIVEWPLPRYVLISITGFDATTGKDVHARCERHGGRSLLQQHLQPSLARSQQHERRGIMNRWWLPSAPVRQQLLSPTVEFRWQSEAGTFRANHRQRPHLLAGPRLRSPPAHSAAAKPLPPQISRGYLPHP